MTECKKAYKFIAMAATLFILAIVCAVIVSYGVGVTYAFEGAGAGTEEAPYEISNATELKSVADDVNAGLYDGYYGMHLVLTKDIDLTDTGNWSPIGTEEYPFKGIFNGNGHSIIGLSIVNDKDSNVPRTGLFGTTAAGSIIRNLTIEGSVSGVNNTAAVVGYNEGRIENCFNKAAVSAVSGSVNIGGIVGHNSGEIIGCGNYGKINGDFLSIIGGVAGGNTGLCRNCFNVGDMQTIDAVAGGIVGQNTATGEVACSFNVGRISGKSDIGGICGNNFGEISDVYNTGSVISDNGNAGGISGSNETSGKILRVYSVTADIEGRTNIAAITGFNRGIISRGFFDNDKFDGVAVNGYAASESAGLSTGLMTHSDTLESDDKLGALSKDNSDIWTKRDTEDNGCFYPELSYFSENFPDISKLSVQTERMVLGDTDLVLTDNIYTYDGNEKNPGLIYGDLLLEEGQDYTVIYKDNKNAGIAEAEFTLLNYFSGTFIKQFNIEQRDIELEWTIESYIYDGTAHLPTAKIVSGIVGSEQVTLKYDYETSVNAGHYTATVRLAETEVNKNYKLDDSTEETLNYEIKKRPISIIWSEEMLVYNGQAQMPSLIEIEGRIGDDDITFSYDYSQNTNADDYEVSIALAETEINANYLFETQVLSYTIERRPITIIWDDSKLTYNGKVQYPKAEVGDGKIGDEAITFVYSGYEDNVNADENEGHLVTIELENTDVNANYLLDPQIYHYSIYRSPLTIEWWDTPLVYSGQAQCPGYYIVAGRIGHDEPIFTVSDYSKNTEANVEYSVVLTLAEDEANANYSFVSQTKSYVISKATFNIETIAFQDKIFAYDGSVKDIYIDNDLPVGVTVSYENNSQTEIGKYSVIARFSVNETNYNALDTDHIEATLYIAQTVFNNDDGIVRVAFKGEIIYGANVVLKPSEDTETYKAFGKSVMLCYDVELYDYSGGVEITTTLTEEILNQEGLRIEFIDADGRVVSPDFSLNGNVLTFTANNVAGFAVVADTDFTLLYILLGVAVFIITCVVIIVLIFRKKKKQIIRLEEVGASDRDHEQTDEPFTARQSNTGELDDTVDLESPSLDKPFVFDGIKCLSYEWFLRGLSVRTMEKQERICSGDEKAFALKESLPRKYVFWRGKKYAKNSEKYKQLLERARRAADEENN